MAKDPYRYFRVEARELLGQLNQAALTIEKGELGTDSVRRLLRVAHTLKGAARIVKRPEIAERAHGIEEALGPYRDEAGLVPREAIDLIMHLSDEIDAQVQALTAVASIAPAETAAPGSVSEVEAKDERPATAADGSVRLVRAEIEEMDAVLDGVTETHTLLGTLSATPRELEQIQHLAGLLVEQLTSRGTADGQRQSLAGRGRALDTAQELRKQLGDVAGRVDLALEQINREIGQLREAAEQMRLVSAGSHFVVLERAARDIARELNKAVAFDSVGGEIRLDAHVMSVVQAALVQIIRNAVAHGIESAEERAAAGKPARGRVSLGVSRRGRQIVFRCQDDGRGVDLDAVRRVAEQRGLLDAAQRSYEAKDLIRLLLRGGISTSRTVTEVAGRGIGLDVVRDSVAQLGGDVTIDTKPGHGTVFELVVPLSVASLEALAVEAAGNIVTLPMDTIRRVMHLVDADVAWASDGATTLHDGRAVPFVSLPQALYGTRPPAGRNWPTVIVASGDRRAAVGVDRLIGTVRVVVRPLAHIAPVSEIVAGASLDTEGNPQLVLDSDGLVSLASRGLTAERQPGSQGLSILVVDDSLTTRMLEQSILEGAGYQVDTASSGEDGLEKIRRKHYALVLCDVEMPGIDGFTVVEQVRADPAIHDVPVILVTSRAAAEDVKRGEDVRAAGYVIKSEFDQTKLLSMIRSLTSGHP